MAEATDDFLAHYGVVGMKWGKRRGSIADRVKGATLDRNQRLTSIATRAKEGRGTREERLVGAPAKMLLGKKRVAKNLDKSINKLNAQSARIASGKTTLRDKIDMTLTTGTLDLLVSRQDNKG